MEVVIHADPSIEWHKIRLPAFVDCLKVLGIKPIHTISRERISEAPAVLFGTTLWKGIESVAGDWLLVDRASYGDPEYVTLGWNGHGGRADHCIPEFYDTSRWDAFPQPFKPEQKGDECAVICGQCETYSPAWSSVEEWYEQACYDGATHFRPHPSGSAWNRLPIKKDFRGSTALVLNSSIGVQCVFDGVPVQAYDEGAMCYGLWDRWGNDRAAWAHWLAWTQWRWDEIQSGAIRHIFDRVA